MTAWPPKEQLDGYSSNPLQGIELLHGVPITRHTPCPQCGASLVRGGASEQRDSYGDDVWYEWWACSQGAACGWRTPGLYT